MNLTFTLNGHFCCMWKRSPVNNKCPNCNSPRDKIMFVHLNRRSWPLAKCSIINNSYFTVGSTCTYYTLVIIHSCHNSVWMKKVKQKLYKRLGKQYSQSWLENFQEQLISNFSLTTESLSAPPPQERSLHTMLRYLWNSPRLGPTRTRQSRPGGPRRSRLKSARRRSATLLVSG